jgi:general secretion pathway protein N
VTKYAPAVVALALLAILALQWLRWPPPARQSPTTGGPAATESVAAPQPDLLARLESKETKDSYASMTEHPLFRPDRKPEPPPDAEPAAPPGKDDAGLKLMDLSAVLITPSAVSAWVRDPSQPKLQRLRIGDDFKGWSVRQILEDRVLLERQGERDALILRDYSQMPPAAATPPSNQRRPPRAPVRAIPPKK